MKLYSVPDRLGPLLLLGAVTAVLLALAMPGHTGWWPLLFVALVPLLMGTLYASPGRSALMGFCFGLLYHLALLYWILIVLGRYGGLPIWISLPALVLLAAYMACYSALFCALLSLLTGRYWHRERSVADLVWAAPTFWVGLDYLRGYLFTGFPWMDLGYGLFSQPTFIQAADLGGHHLITFSLVLCNGLILGIIDRQRRAVHWNLRRERRLLLMAWLVLIFVGGYSYVRYQVMESTLGRSLQAQVAVVQGNIDQSIKWSEKMRAATVESYLNLSRQVLEGTDTELVVWPETALPFFPQQDPLMYRVTDFVTTANTWLLTGAPLYKITPGEEEVDQVEYFNGALLIGPDGQPGGQYAKQHLVPFGEYVPLRRYLPFLEPLVVSIGDFTPGTSSAPLELGTMRLGILICYESIFPAIARQTVDQGANLLVNITNDAWYGQSSAPYQSMAMTVFRAVENRRTLVRAANTGISASVDPLGRIVGATALFTEAALLVQAPLLTEESVFNRHGYNFGKVCAVLIPLLLVIRGRQR
ncbi:apolipoprotein N-acyltransferase [Desulfobulbus alkaliphilus]|uniref:apolipoprotein N-acyltransferase n=1 Tax=Desulfobulbus alkaliphilus TaxID=869814 RepID=UPI0019635800|nr:apolipoprotein N-acyltransferase [Desulfobulbus alkaliphilus]MBM9536159.1 apolipoprotein N-acyltransferase [Desulfobulbus alkaliphilus]